jgi:anti-sigma B factor antagonist
VATTGDFDVELVRIPNGAAVVRVVGELDMATSSQLEDAIAAALPVRTLVVDLTGCSFLDSAGVRMLMTAARDARENDRSLALVAVDPGVLRVLEITALDTMVPVHSTLDDAL